MRGFEHFRPNGGARRVIALVANQDAGSARLVRRARRALRRDAHLVVERVVGGKGLEAALVETAAALAGHDGARLAVAGGDGTLGVAARVLAGTNIALCVLPCGTGNDLARCLGVPLCPEEAAAIAVGGPVQALDLVATELGTFAHAAGVGVMVRFAEAVAGVRGWRRPFLYPLRAYEAWRGRRPLDLVVSVDGEPFEPLGPPLEVAIVNAPRLGGRIGLRLGAASPDDGRVEVVAISQGAGRAALMGLAHYLRASVAAPPARALLRSGAEIRLKAASPFAVSLDGERAGTTSELSARVVPGACAVVVPANWRRRGSWRSRSATLP
ncbi:MAG: diacylglycerol kinase family protein [Actinomycetota bacterium]|nr:diacylglycerol kinase family protein [Actinomycetota bacterium]